MDNIKVTEIIDKYNKLDFTFNGTMRRAYLYDIVNTDVRKNGHEFAVAVYRDYDYAIEYEVDVLMYNQEIFDMYTSTIKKV